ncbi:MAG: carboxypeptidase-like regulatory domain-containing protein [Planctomycetota bacterium]
MHVSVACGAPRATPALQGPLAGASAPAALVVQGDQQPAPQPYPAPPGIEFEPGEAPPSPADLARDAAVVGRLTEQGQSATLRFDALEGELSLFALTAFGYARGWNAGSRLEVRDTSGSVLAQRSRAGGAQFDDFLAFVAPSAGRYTLHVIAEENYFRYLVVRHAGYRVVPADATRWLTAAGDEVAHGWTDVAHPRQRFLVRGAPGSTIALSVEPTLQRARKQLRAFLARRAPFVAGLVDPRRADAQGDPRARRDESFPELALAVGRRGPALDLPEPALPVTIATLPASGELEVLVCQQSSGPGGLFDLSVERDVVLASLAIRVGDTDDDPLADVQVVLLREPALQRVAQAKTGADGTAALVAPAGPYTVVFRAPGRGPETVRTTLVEGTPLNLVAND